MPDNSHHLVAATQRRRADTLDRAQRTLHDLAQTGQRFTVTDIAARAGVSRAWLYTQPELRDDIRRLTAYPQATADTNGRAERGSVASLRQRLTLAHERIRELDNENRQLRNQLAHLHGQLRAARVTDTVYDTNTQLTPLNGRNDPR
jgi:Family of unknown function (DUF6262)